MNYDLRRAIAVDLDGTLCTEEKVANYHRAQPLPGARTALQRLRQQGWYIIIHTARYPDQRALTEHWFQENGFSGLYDELVMGKPLARYHIDDKAIRFTSWPEILDKLKTDGDPPVGG